MIHVIKKGIKVKMRVTVGVSLTFLFTHPITSLVKSIISIRYFAPHLTLYTQPTWQIITSSNHSVGVNLALHFFSSLEVSFFRTTFYFVPFRFRFQIFFSNHFPTFYHPLRVFFLFSKTTDPHSQSQFLF